MSNRNVLLLPFDLEVWLVSGVAMLTLFLSSVMMGWVVGRCHIQITKAGGVSMWVIGVLLGQGTQAWSDFSGIINALNCIILGGDIILATLPLRTVAFTAAVTTSLLYNFYTGAFLTSVSSPPAALKTFDAFKKLDFTIFTDPDLIFFVAHFIKVSEYF